MRDSRGEQRSDNLQSETFVILPDKLYKIEIRRGVAIICGIYPVKNKGHPKIATRDIVVEGIIIVHARKFEEKFVNVEIVQ